MARRRRLRGPKGSGVIDQLPSGRWRLRVPIEDGKRRTYGTYDTEAEAADAQARWRLTSLLPGEDPDVEVVAPPVRDGTCCDEWFGRWQEAKSARQSTVRVNRKRGGAASTAARDRQCWRTWWSPFLGDRLPRSVTERDIVAVVEAMEAAGRAPLTVRTHWIMVKAFFAWLADEEAIGVSPIAKATVSIDPANDRLREIIVPDFRFIDLLTQELGEGEDRLIFELLLGTGGRRSEVAGFTVADVDLGARRVWVRRPLVEVEGKLVRSRTPKGGRHRAVIVGPQLAKLLRQHLVGMGSPAPGDPLFSSPEGTGFRWNNYIARSLRPALKRTAARWAVAERDRLIEEGLQPEEATVQADMEAAKLTRLTPHHLRHTAAALLWAAGATDIEVQLILGHADLDTSKQLYGHLLHGSGDSAAARVEQLRVARRAG